MNPVEKPQLFEIRGYVNRPIGSIYSSAGNISSIRASSFNLLANILLDDDFKLKIADFGISLLAHITNNPTRLPSLSSQQAIFYPARNLGRKNQPQEI